MAVNRFWYETIKNQKIVRHYINDPIYCRIDGTPEDNWGYKTVKFYFVTQDDWSKRLMILTGDSVLIEPISSNLFSIRLENPDEPKTAA